jgi:hypothetical protein
MLTLTVLPFRVTAGWLWASVPIATTIVPPKKSETKNPPRNPGMTVSLVIDV